MTRRGVRRAAAWSAALALVASVAGCGGCGAGEPAGGGSDGAKASFPGAPIVLVSIDTLRSDRLPAYGYEAGETPAIDALAADGVVFERAYAHYPLTLPSHASMLTGLLPPTHGVRDNLGYRLGEDVPYLPEILARAGYATGAAVSAVVLEGSTGLARGFDLYDDDFAADGTPRPGLGLGSVQRPGGATWEALGGWLGSVAGRPFFLFLHLYEPHAPYEPPAPWAGRHADPYDGEIAAADAVVGEVVEELRRLGLYEESLVVVTSDHGEGLGDHGEQEHGVLLYREALQVPLVVKLPGNARAGERIATPVGLADLAPTLLVAAGEPLPEGLEGAPLFDLPKAPRPLYAETHYPRLHLGWSELTSLVDGRWHLIDGRRPELFDLEADPGETNDLVATERRTRAALAERLAAFVRPLEPPAEIDPRAAERLAALGYLGGATSPAADGPLPDPRERVGDLERLRRAQGLLAAGRPAEAEAELAPLVESSPDMREAWASLGLARVHQGRPEAAIDAYQEALRLAGPDRQLAVRLASLYTSIGRPERAAELVAEVRAGGVEAPELVREQGMALLEAGRAAEAVRLLEPAAAEGDPDVRVALAVAHQRTGRPDRAVALLEQVLADRPAHPKALETLGAVLLGGGRVGEARSLLERAVAADPTLPNAWNALGVARQQSGDTDGALAAWQRAVTLDARMFDALYNLGLVAAADGRRDLAVGALRRYVETAPPARYRAEIARARQALGRLEAG